MISICLKSTDINSLNFIENYLDNSTFPEIYYSQKKFKYFNNIIIHYLGYNYNGFYNEFSQILSKYIIKHCEKNFIKQQLSFDFFYFSSPEKSHIENLVLTHLAIEQNNNEKLQILKSCIYEYFVKHKTCILEGFINFRLHSYKTFINSVLEDTINDYILQKEYSEYVDLLQEYINIQPPQSKCVHLVYNENIKLLLDDSKNVITNTENIGSQIYLSDISFSSNDFILNSLLSLLPNKIFIHLNSEEDNFIKFLKLIFKNRFVICNNCSICNLYQKSKNINIKK